MPASVKREILCIETESTFELLQSREQTANACPYCAHSSPYISHSLKTHLEINSSNIRPQSAQASQMDHTLYITLVWTYSFSILQASLHMSFLYAFDLSAGQMLCIASNEQNLIYRSRAADERLLPLILRQVFQDSTCNITQSEIETQEHNI